jgi:hypothetical protein
MAGHPVEWRSKAAEGRDWSHAQDAKHLSMAKPCLLTERSRVTHWEKTERG